MIGNGKPLVARIGGVEVVTIPMEHYAALLSPLALVQGVQAGTAPNVEGMLELLTALRAKGVITAGGMANATGLSVDEVGERVAAWKAAQPQPWTGDMHDDGTIEHSTALLSPPALARGTAEVAPQLDAEGMLAFLMQMDEGAPYMPADLVKATGLDVGTFTERKAAWKAAQPQPWTAVMHEDRTITGLTDKGQRFTMEPLPRADAAPVEIAPTPEEATVDLVPDRVEVPLTAGDVAASYDAAVQSGDVRGGAMDRKGQPVEGAGKGVAALDAERGTAKRSRR